MRFREDKRDRRKMAQSFSERDAAPDRRAVLPPRHQVARQALPGDPGSAKRKARQGAGAARKSAGRCLLGVKLSVLKIMQVPEVEVRDVIQRMKIDK